MGENNLLPSGSIVLLEGGTKKLMIYGRKQIVVSEDPKMFDYIGVFYPEGYINQEYTFAFNHSDIEKVIFEGYEDEEEREFQHVLKEAAID
ncbi:hypothetical protein CHCC14820_1174 [Bacillus paralicheniformis]|uniref:DUF4176 domain-containing protein n=1 Tax=Bacillus paralicheniformis TaxID=1648923 RepID=A0AAW6K6M2_9BACI|nr:MULTISPECIES: DUF4176 domain-containing protein [Bacillus]KUL17045.1 hypothetical protein LI6934_12860 [Bacillus licheniformis LMG 6934]MBG9881508.1 cytoplasmic protein [Bacillus paralicheniformis]MDE1376531.1 DUF4176 domain-containing protein [Bacillus licheniformis]MDE1385687.1 DUF4176 domain-containing protein [Bacillus paralicheniformis]MDE1392732.1 DUF4176 domain-containing protein [Bacillus paralicheniformis]